MTIDSVSDTRYEQRAVFEFLVAEQERVVNIHKLLCAGYGSCAVDRSTVRHWVQRVKASGRGETELHDPLQSVGLATATSSKKNEFQDNSFHQKGHDHRILDIDGVILVDVMVRGETNQTRTSKPSKNWNSFTGECGLTGIQETC